MKGSMQIELPEWYLEIPDETPRPIEEVSTYKEAVLVGYTCTPAEVCIKNVLPVASSILQLQTWSQRSSQRNMN